MTDVERLAYVIVTNGIYDAANQQVDLLAAEIGVDTAAMTRSSPRCSTSLDYDSGGSGARGSEQ